MTNPHSPDHPVAPAIGSCSGSTLGLLFRQARDAMWARMEVELARCGHELNFSQFITIKTLANSTVRQLPSVPSSLRSTDNVLPPSGHTAQNVRFRSVAAV